MTRADDGEVILEIMRVGAYLKVSAIDPVSLIEVSVMGPSSGGIELARRAAVRKLRYVLAKWHGEPAAATRLEG